MVDFLVALHYSNAQIDDDQWFRIAMKLEKGTLGAI